MKREFVAERTVQRVRIVVVVFGLALVMAGTRSALFQLVPNEKLEQLSRQQSRRELEIPATRGDVVDRHGKLLAGSVDVFSIYADPRQVDPNDAKSIAKQLSQLVNEPFDTLYRRLVSDRAFVWLARQRSPELRDQINSLNLPGIGVRRESRRYYPERALASNILGFTDLDGHGLEGIERSHESRLAGRPKEVSVMRDALGHYLLFERGAEQAVMEGERIRLSIDSAIQYAAEEALRSAMQKFNAKAAMAVVLDVSSSEVLAMASEPHFNSNEPGAFDPAARRNRVVTDMFEPGSTLKPLVIASALDHEVVAENAIIFCENGKLEVSGHTIRDGKGYGWLSLDQIIQKSSNIGAARVGQALGRRRLGVLLLDLGFGRRSGLPIPGETSGIVRPSESWSDVGLVNISFGHGVAVSAIQLASAYRTLAAEGVYLAPRLVLDEPDTRAARRVFSRGAAARVTRMMIRATEPEGTGALAAINGYRVAGKTGTAQKIDPVSGGYSRESHIAAFSGFLPAEDPAAVITVVIDEPRPLYSGGKVAAPVFAQIARATMRELGRVPNDELLADSPESEAVPEIGSGAVPLALAAALGAARAATGDGVPSFIGLTAREALDAYARRGLSASIELEGTGRVVSQDPRPGSPLQESLRLSLAPTGGVR